MLMASFINRLCVYDVSQNRVWATFRHLFEVILYSKFVCGSCITHKEDYFAKNYIEIGGKQNWNLLFLTPFG